MFLSWLLRDSIFLTATFNYFLDARINRAEILFPGRFILKYKAKLALSIE